MKTKKKAIVYFQKSNKNNENLISKCFSYTLLPIEVVVEEEEKIKNEDKEEKKG